MTALRRMLPSILWMALIFYMSSQTGDDVDGWVDIFRQFIPAMEGFDWGHFISYCILGWTYLWALRPARITLGIMSLVVLLCVLYGVTDEFHQQFVPRRSSSLLDLRNDAIGAAVGMLIIRIPAVSRLYFRLAGVKNC